MTTVEQPCYTIINLPTDSEPYNEMQLKMDLGMYSVALYKQCIKCIEITYHMVLNLRVLFQRKVM